MHKEGLSQSRLGEGWGGCWGERERRDLGTEQRGVFFDCLEDEGGSCV